MVQYSHGSVSVFQVSTVSVFRYTGRHFFQVGSVFVVSILKYRDIDAVTVRSYL